MPIAILTAVLVSVWAGALHREPLTPPAENGLATADSLVSEWVAAERVAGAVLLVRRGGATVLERAYGWSQLYGYGAGQYEGHAGIQRLAQPVPMSVGTVFDVASVTKVMATTLAVMELVGRGRVELDAPVYRYLGDFRGPDKDRITVRHLLSHTSGLRQWVPVYYHAADPERAYEYVRDLPLGWPPGAGRHYSDLGFMLLGRLVESVEGRPLDRVVSDRLHRPLGLTSTGYRRSPSVGSSPLAATSHGNPFERRMVHDSTFGYRIEGDPHGWDGWRTRTLVGEVNDGNAFHAFGGVAGHAGLFASAAELGTLVQLLLDRGVAEGRRYLEAEVVEAFTTAELPGQALGWQVPDYAPAGSFFHTGFTGTYVLGVPSHRLVVVLLTNRQNVGVDASGSYTDVAPLQRAVARSLLSDGG